MVVIVEASDSDSDEVAAALAATPAASAEQTQDDVVDEDDGQRAEGTGTGATVEEMIEKERKSHEEARNDFYLKQVHFFGGSNEVRRVARCSLLSEAPTPHHRGV